MYRPKVVPTVVHVAQGGAQQPQQPVVLGTIVGQPPLPVGASAVHPDGLNQFVAPPPADGQTGDRRGLNPLVTMATIVNSDDGDKAKQQQTDPAWLTGGADGSAEGSRAVDRRMP